MIATLKGTVSEKLHGVVVIDVGGLGYGVLVTAEDYGRLKTGESKKLYIYEHIRESSHDLFGFVNLDTKTLFELLLGVNGVGPRMALNMLSTGNVAEVSKAIAAGDVKYIQSANGVGKKVAERVVVDLKDKVGLTSSSSDSLFVSSAAAQKDEAVQALMALGFNSADAVNALSNIDNELPTDQRVKQALKAGA